MKDKNIFPDEERIKMLLKADIDCAAGRAGNWKEIASAAYEHNDHVKRSSILPIFCAVCAVLMIISLAAIQITSGSFYDFSGGPNAAGSGGANPQTTEIAAAEADGFSVSTRAANGAMITDLRARFSRDSDGSPLNDSYSLSYSFIFPKINMYTDYGLVYTYVVCEGELISSDDEPLYYKAGDTADNAVSFKMKKITSSEQPLVTLIACFVRTGATSSDSTAAVCSSINLRNPDYDIEEADRAYENDEIMTDITSGDDSGDLYSWSLTDGSYYYGRWLKDIKFAFDRNFFDIYGFDVIFITGGGTMTVNGTGSVSSRVDAVQFDNDDDRSASVFTAEFDMSDIVDLYTSGDSGFLIAAAISRENGNIVLSPVYPIGEIIE